jgi:amidase
MTDLADVDATATAALIRDGELTPSEAVEASIARIEKLNPGLNAVIHPLFDKAMEAAASPELPYGPFRGVPILLKDLSCPSAGDPFHLGMRFLRDLEWRAARDSTVAARLRAAGFVFVGRTNTPELGLIPTTEPVAYGPTRNPWDTSRIPGGSSGGSAAAVASRMVPVANGSDGGGSVRIPASACGLVGLKPSRGRVPSGPDNGESMGGLSVEHVLARTVRDSAAILDVLQGVAAGDPYTAPAPLRAYADEVDADPGALRIGVMRRAPSSLTELHPDVLRAVDDAAGLLGSFGHEVGESHPVALDEPEHILHFGVITGCDAAASLEAWSDRTGKPIAQDDVEINTWAIAELGRACSGQQLLASREWLFAYARRMAEWWLGGYDLLLTPTLTAPPPPIGTFVATPDNPLGAGAAASLLVPFTPPFNATGQPAISLPVSWNAEGLPIGVQLVAAYGHEEVLIRVASQLEQACGWAARKPPVSA